MLGLQIEENTKLYICFCRTIFASYLEQSGIESKIVDLLHGRVQVCILHVIILLPGYITAYVPSQTTILTKNCYHYSSSFTI